MFKYIYIYICLIVNKSDLPCLRNMCCLQLFLQ